MNRNKTTWGSSILIVLCLVAIAAAFIIVNKSQDDTPSATTEDHRRAAEMWNDLGDIEQNIICNIWVDYKAGDPEAVAFVEEASTENSEPVDESYAKAKIDLLERECDEYL